MISEKCKNLIRILTKQPQRLVPRIALITLLLLLHAGCSTQATQQAPTPSLAPITSTALPPSTTERAAPSTIVPTIPAITHTAVLLPTVSPPADNAIEGSLMNLRDIPRYPGVQPMPPDKNPVLATLIESIRQQIGAESQLEAEVFLVLSVEAAAPVRDIELFYITELADWQPYPEPRYDIVVPEDGAEGQIATHMSWGTSNQTFTIMVMERYSQYFLITLLQSDA